MCDPRISDPRPGGPTEGHSDSYRSARSQRDRRIFAAALMLSVGVHGALLAAAAVVLHRHAYKPPIAAIVRGDQGGDGGAIFDPGLAFQSPPPVLPSIPSNDLPTDP